MQRELTWDDKGPEVSLAESSDPAPSLGLLMGGARKQQQQGTVSGRVPASLDGSRCSSGFGDLGLRNLGCGELFQRKNLYLSRGFWEGVLVREGP